MVTFPDRHKWLQLTMGTHRAPPRLRPPSRAPGAAGEPGTSLGVLARVCPSG